MDPSNHVLLKLRRIMGETAAGDLVNEVMAELALPDLDTPAHRFAFGEGLAKRGGVYEVLGRAIRVQAALQGAKPAA